MLSQYFIRRKARRDLMITKIEEFYGVLLEYEEHSFDTLSLCVAKTDEGAAKMRNSVGSVISSLRKARTINQLYFPEIKFDKEEFYALSMDFMPYVKEQYRIGANEGLENALNQAFAEISAKVSYVEKQLQAEMEKYRH
jgi:hypothetical protein